MNATGADGHRGVRMIAIAAACAYIPLSSAAAQTTTGYVDLTAANTHYGDTFSGTSYAVAPRFRVEAPEGVFDGGATYSTLAGSWTAQGDASASLFTRRIGALMGEIAGLGSGTANADGTHTGTFTGVGRLHFLTDERGAWVGAGAGRIWDGTLWRSLVQAEAGAWANVPHGSLSLVVIPSKLGDSIRYTDGEATLSVFHNRIGIDFNAGVRAGSSLPVSGGDKKGWGSAAATYWFTRAIAIVGGAGTYPVNFGQGFPGGRFVSIGIRIGAIPSDNEISEFSNTPVVTTPGVLLPGLPTAPLSPATGAVGDIRVESVRPGVERLSIQWPSARTIEIAGDFTNWDPVPLARGADGSWSATITAAPGVHEINIRADGGKWVVPPGLGIITDEFGGQVGLLVVGM